ncbi:hypothetical protein E4N72_10715 [Treponema vincentii]|nr:hypothetical protein [Treponema vincentii]UTC46977.1 hypothetical protein E4N72_10715 [Treponema vincentii]
MVNSRGRRNRAGRASALLNSEHGKFKVTPNGGQNWSVGSNGYLTTP